ncbi:hypothetical protein JTT07_14995 [Clostridium botulinum]|nr:hypothetical protein [Clostridium botulinum]
MQRKQGWFFSKQRSRKSRFHRWDWDWGVLLGIGIYGISQSAVYGTGSLVVGAVAGISNCANLKRIKRKK